jgi:hypothetical protein
VHNLSSQVFYPGSRGGSDGNVLASYHWLDEGGARVPPWDRPRTEMPARISPGQSAAMFLKVPDLPPPGKYQLQLDLVEEQIGWASYVMQPPAYPVEVVSKRTRRT